MKKSTLAVHQPLPPSVLLAMTTNCAYYAPQVLTADGNTIPASASSSFGAFAFGSSTCTSTEEAATGTISGSMTYGDILTGSMLLILIFFVSSGVVLLALKRWKIAPSR